MGYVEKYYRGGLDTNANVAHAHCVLDNQGYTYTLRICNTYYLSATMVTRAFPVFQNCVVKLQKKK